ncbi:MAG: protein phosphatase 2C domain-containing protein [Bacteroidia bacterium]|jgi:hypothetical protein|nr:protein phosphatase 2C domain-containing protein [Bacteroidia bacterium]
MKIYTTLQIGEYHVNHCEDYLFSEYIVNNKLLCAVMDGCTMGNDSYLIATITGKLLRKIVKARNYEALYNPDASSTLNLTGYLKSILNELFQELNSIRNQLQLEKKELLTTLILLLLDVQKNEGIVLVIGDGVVSINGRLIDFDQDNKPDYLGFHLHEDFEKWFEDQQQLILFDRIEDISIATDGILTFTQVKQATSSERIDPAAFLLNDYDNPENEDLLTNKLKVLEYRYGLKHTDDLALVRVVKSHE